MNLLLFCAAAFLLIFAASAAHTAQRPVISEVFEARLFFEVRERQGDEYNGQGVWAADQVKGASLEILHFEHDSALEAYLLQRYDLGKEYSLSGDNRTCDMRTLDDSMPQAWAWVANSSYIGKSEMNGRKCDVWQFSMGFAVLELGVDTHDSSVPHYLKRTSSVREVIYFFNSWNTSVSDGMFEIPKACHSSHIKHNVDERAPAACRQRSSMLSVAEKWVKAKVPYNQGGHYEGYREDCSGFVSATWALSKPGAVTQTLHEYSKTISKADLQEGDVLLWAAEHVVFFGGWTSKAKTHYTAYEETEPGEGTVKRVTPYPYWYSQSSFIPHRDNNVCK